MDLPTYTNIWRIEKRLYKLYDFRLPAPLPITWIAVFVGITVPYIFFLVVIGLPFNHNLVWLYVLPPGVLTWLTTRPVIENKRLPELVSSQLRYLSEPRTWCRMAPFAEKDEVYVSVRVWHRHPPGARPRRARKAAGRARSAGRALEPAAVQAAEPVVTPSPPSASRPLPVVAPAPAPASARPLPVVAPAPAPARPLPVVAPLRLRPGRSRCRSAPRPALVGCGSGPRGPFRRLSGGRTPGRSKSRTTPNRTPATSASLAPRPPRCPGRRLAQARSPRPPPSPKPVHSRRPEPSQRLVRSPRSEPSRRPEPSPRPRQPGPRGRQPSPRPGGRPVPEAEARARALADPDPRSRSASRPVAAPVPGPRRPRSGPPRCPERSPCRTPRSDADRGLRPTPDPPGPPAPRVAWPVGGGQGGDLVRGPGRGPAGALGRAGPEWSRPPGRRELAAPGQGRHRRPGTRPAGPGGAGPEPGQAAAAWTAPDRRARLHQRRGAVRDRPDDRPHPGRRPRGLRSPRSTSIPARARSPR